MVALGDVVWTPELIEKLKSLWYQTDPQLTTYQIAEKMHMGRYCVIGKVHRLKLTPRQSPIVAKGTKRDLNRSKYGDGRGGVPLPEKFVVKAIPDPTPKKFSCYPCAWPIGNPKQEGFHFCNAQTEIGQSYCAEHRAIAYVKRDRETVDSTRS